MLIWLLNAPVSDMTKTNYLNVFFFLSPSLLSYHIYLYYL